MVANLTDEQKIIYLTRDDEPQQPKSPGDVDFTGDESPEELEAKIARVNAKFGRLP